MKELRKEVILRFTAGKNLFCPSSDKSFVDNHSCRRRFRAQSVRSFVTPRDRSCIGLKENMEYRFLRNLSVMDRKVENTGLFAFTEILSFTAHAAAAEVED